MKICDHRLQP